MSDYGFSFSVKDLSAAQMKQIEANVRSLGGTVKTQTDQMNENFAALGESASHLKNLLVEAFSVYEIYHFGREILDLTAKFQGFDNVIKYSSEGIIDSGRNLDYIKDAVGRLHLPMEQATEAFAEMQAGFYGTGIEGDKLRKVFEGISTASSVLHMNPDQFSRTTYALKEIGELGTVQMRQMRMLAMAMPGAMNLAAQSMGMTSQQFHEAMKKGQIQSSVFLPKFADTVEKHFSPGLGNAGNSLISQMNDAKNAQIQLMLDLGNKLTPFFTHVLKSITEGLNELRGIWDSLSGNSSFVNSLITIFDWVSKLLPIWITYKTVMWATSFATSAFAIENGVLTASLGELTVMTDGSTLAIEGFGSALATIGWGAFIAGIGLGIEKIMALNSEIDQTIDKKTRLQPNKEIFSSAERNFSEIQSKLQTPNMTAQEKGRLMYDIQQQIAEMQAKGNQMGGDVSRANKLVDSANKRPSRYSSLGGWIPFGSGWRNATSDDRTRDDAKELTSGFKTFGNQLATLNKTLTSSFFKGVKPIAPGGGGESPGVANALNTSNLSGASGGLGQSRMIHINIGVMQQNNGVKETKSEAAQAVEILIREINNLSNSQNSQ